MLELLKDYYIFMLIILVISYLVPKDEYKSYIHFFVGIFIVVLFLEPVLALLNTENPDFVSEVFQEFNEQIMPKEGKNQMEMEGSIYEFFFFEGEGE